MSFKNDLIMRILMDRMAFDGASSDECKAARPGLNRMKVSRLQEQLKAEVADRKQRAEFAARPKPEGSGHWPARMVCDNRGAFPSLRDGSEE